MMEPPGEACNHSRLVLIGLAKKHNEFASLSINGLKISAYVSAGKRYLAESQKYTGSTHPGTKVRKKVSHHTFSHCFYLIFQVCLAL